MAVHDKRTLEEICRAPWQRPPPVEDLPPRQRQPKPK
jgi:hypothetical protein